ncbi:hypothetical protein DL771_007611 [Monosporascus sp. 5C6A]|nr:hypothetical protein DL771_007611 [Monosporascus sp. 5C6A]
MRYVLVSGGVISGVGKGIIASSTGLLLKSLGLRISCIKIDPYVSVDAGLMAPAEHGESRPSALHTYRNYERHLGVTLTSDNNITTGKIYLEALQKERRGGYLGKTVQIDPHVVNMILDWIKRVAELGGTAGDIENMPFVQALTQLRHEFGSNNFLSIFVSYVPSVHGEQKTKPTQHAVKIVRSHGLIPDLVEVEQVVVVRDMPTVYQVPLLLREQNLVLLLQSKLNLCGLSIPPFASLEHSCMRVGRNLNIRWIDSEHLESKTQADEPEKYQAAWDQLRTASDIIVPGGFGVRGVEGMMLASKWTRENGTPFLGVCLGFQITVIQHEGLLVDLKKEGAGEYEAHEACTSRPSKPKYAGGPPIFACTFLLAAIITRISYCCSALYAFATRMIAPPSMASLESVFNHLVLPPKLPGQQDSDIEGTVIIEAFEASPTSEDVLAAENALLWDFPGRAVEIPLDEFLTESFQQSLAAFLEQASMESLKRFEARSFKANISVIEARNTTHPALITQMLMPLLEALGVHAPVPRLRKRVRDDVNIQDAELPWRRLPFWLVIRVATQRQLSLLLDNDTGRACYKFLICIVLAQLLDDCVGQLAPELILTLRAKLCRRLAKLEMDKTRVGSSASGVYNELFGSTGPLLKRVIETATVRVEAAWAGFKRTIIRPVPNLPSRADKHALRLSLPNSGKYLDDLLRLRPVQRTGTVSLHLSGVSDSSVKQVQNFTDRYFKLARMETTIKKSRQSAPNTVKDCQARCLELANSITDLFTVVGSAYDSNPEQMSIFILNLFELWVQMDECAIRACPLLQDYHPIFSGGLLDVLQLPTLSDMQRLQRIQNYLRERCANCRLIHKNIFSRPDKDCFAAQYLALSTQLQNLQRQIENASKRSRASKESEWEEACKKFDSLSEEISSRTCVCSLNPDESRNTGACEKCRLWRRRKRMKIRIHEDLLPEDCIRKAIVVFELGIPSYLAAYRNVTWRIFRDLGHPSKPGASRSPAILLKSCTQLQGYMGRAASGISLASAKKSFLQTHFKALKMKVGLSSILFPLGADFEFYDLDSGIWVKDLDKPLTFQHLCGIHVPRGLQVSVIPPSEHPPADTDGPSSYEILANQTECPPDMSIHEFMAYQRLLSGKTRRWPTMLVELGSSNLNFSSEDTMHVFAQLAVQAGPQNAAELLRETHSVFKEELFCQRLAEQINKRLRSIASNWRETHCMEILITLSLRLFSLTSGTDRQSAECLLKTARNVTVEWICHLRNEVRTAAEADAAERAATYGFWAALLCRRTFTVFVGSSPNMDEEDLCSFFQASIALQENLVVDLEKLPQNLRNMLVRDAKMSYGLQRLIRQSIGFHPGSLEAAVSKSWFDSGNSIERTFSRWQFLGPPNERWVASIITTTAHESTSCQVVHYNFIEGHLLIGGKPLGRLPLNIRTSEDVKELFGNQHLLTYPSWLSDMTYMLATPLGGHQIHFGLRGERVVIRASTQGGLLEYVPRRVFAMGDSFDLPSGLVDNCVHWINLRSRCLEIRRKPVIWKTRLNDWILDIPKRQAHRGMVLLVDPHSDLCKRVAKLFRHFEAPERLTVFQPPVGKLAVELRHLELSFFVNRNHLLECRELHAEIDPNQEAGTLYGLESKIVLRDVDNKKRRSIIIPLGPPTWMRHGMHVAVRACSTNEYGRFEIDDVLGRLLCPPEPRLLYSKALYHALTSFVLPDPLTGRTGTEEAIHILKSGSSQPWTPLGSTPIAILKILERLSPNREFYPKDKECLQTAAWDQYLTVSIQHDSFGPLIQKILGKSDRLGAFFSNSGENLDLRTLSHLRRRGEIRRLLYERGSSDSGGLATGQDKTYQSRDRNVLSQATNVFRIVKLIRNRPFSLHMNRGLRAILQSWKLIGGFHATPGITPRCLSNLIDDSISEQWGNLVNFCRSTEDPYRLIFRLAPLSFGPAPDMDTIRVLAAFGCLEELRALPTPSYPSFVGFKTSGSPTLEFLKGLISAAYLDFGPKHQQKKGVQDEARENHRLVCEAEGRRFARFILDQWPSSKPSTKGFVSSVIDVNLALDKIIPEWERLHQNKALSEYVTKVQKILDNHKGKKDKSMPVALQAESPVFCGFHRDRVIPSLSQDLLIKCGPLSLSSSSPSRKQLVAKGLSRGVISSKEIIELSKILDSFARSPDVLRQQYGNDLGKSLAALKDVSSQPKLECMPSVHATLRGSIEQARLAMGLQFDHVEKAFSADDGRFPWLKLGNLWPCTTPMTILELLRSSADNRFGRDMRQGLISYGVLVTNLQRLERIMHAHLKRDQRKTSCIVPMAMALLANKKQLSRLIVPKALLLQTAQTVQSRLGGLVGRQVRHIPFSRRTPTTPAMLRLYSELHEEVLLTCGVILTAPEHILAYKLSGLQRLADSKIEEAREMIQFQSRLTDMCRDVLDESDFTLAVKTQLIYPSGSQIHVDGHPHRWKVAQMLLSLVEDHLPGLQCMFPRSIEVVRRPHGFPMVHFLKRDVEDELHRRIIDDICNGQTSFLRLADSTSSGYESDIRRVLSEENVDKNEIKRAYSFFADNESAPKSLLLVRGLLLNRILLLCLKKRWNVQYGLHPNRPPVAVPFEAKGVPSEQAEFGHPDVAILFTCLSFYYSGLSLSQFREGLQYVLKSDDPAAEYDRWTYGCDALPEALHHWNVINTDDQGQVEELWRHLRLDRTVLDHYMNNFVFPVHAKQFGIKLQASGWDLPLFPKSRSRDKTGARTTGFSGTNDNKMMLPLTIQQDDLPSLRQTNAEVLTYLLQNRNRGYHLASWLGRRMTEKELLRRIADMSIRILIDAGAYVLEMDNRSLVRAWLSIDTQAKAAVFFGADNRAWVQYRGVKEEVPLLATPFADSLEECLVYLDEAHTRGVDLNLPPNATGALTLALGQTKDQTVQAAMRLRQLGTTQSIVFFAPPEVHQSILDVCKLRGGEAINSSHVIMWLLEQTCRMNEQLQNLYFAQGSDFCRRTNAQWVNPKFLTDKAHYESLLKVIQNPERQTLEELYGGMAESQSSSFPVMSFANLKGFMEKLIQQRREAGGKWHGFHSSALEEVEQEREVELQVEEVRHVQKPERYKALTFPGLHPAVSRFARTGELTGGKGYKHAFGALEGTNIGQKYNVCRTASRLFVSTEFMRTVATGKRHPPDDNFLRPVEWILWSRSSETALVIIPEEAELLIPVIRRAGQLAKVHLIAYAAPVTKSMMHFNDFSYYTIPRLPAGYKIPVLLSIELGIFAGRLYIEFGECAPLTRYLQGLSEETDADAALQLTGQPGLGSGIFTKNPVSFLLEWLTLRRKAHDIMHTPMGYICRGRTLHKSHPFFVGRSANAQEIVPPSVGARRLGGNMDGLEEVDSEMEDEWDPFEQQG